MSFTARIASSFAGMIRVAVRIDHRDHRDLQASRLVDRDVLTVRVHHEDRGRRPAKLAHAGEVAVEVRELVVETLGILLRHRGEVAPLLALHEVVETLDALLDRDEVGEEPAEPALVHVVHPRALGLLGDGFLRLLLRPDEEDLPAVAGEVAHERVRLLNPGERLLKIDDVDAVPLHEDEALHLRVPAARLMSEVDSGLQELLHGDDGHVSLPYASACGRCPGGRLQACEVPRPRGYAPRTPIRS